MQCFGLDRRRACLARLCVGWTRIAFKDRSLNLSHACLKDNGRKSDYKQSKKELT